MSIKVSLSMLDVLQGIKDGKVYILRGDRGHGLEENRSLIKKKVKHAKCLAPLVRKGLVDFVVYPTDMSRFYRIRLTLEGERALTEGVK